jgi:hypothetical protein
MSYSHVTLRVALPTCAASLALGAAAIAWADFGMPGWFFVVTQVWFWTVGLPTMLGVLAVTAAWGIPGWTTFPLWLFVLCAALVALIFQSGALLLANTAWKRFQARPQ